jgi:hypothetical protein
MMQHIRTCILLQPTSRNGKRISIHNLGKNQSEIARREIEEKYGLVKAGGTAKQELGHNLEKAVYGKSETKKTIDNIVSQVVNRYKFSSLTEFNAVLRQYNVMADRGKEGMVMFNKIGLLYSMLDAKGNKVGVPIKASALNSKPTLKNLQTLFQRGASLRQNEKERLTTVINSFFQTTHSRSRTDFCDYMKSNGINVLFRENKDGRVYGLTFVDNKSGAVFNGSDLGKTYSGQALTKQFEVQRSLTIPIKEEWHGTASLLHLMPGVSKEMFNVMMSQKLGDESIDPRLKRKKKRGISR